MTPQSNVSEIVTRYGLRERIISTLIRSAVGENHKYSRCCEAGLVLSWEHFLAPCEPEEDVLNKIALSIIETLPTIQGDLNKAFPDLSIKPLIKSEIRTITAAGLNMRYFDIPPHAREFAFTMKFKTVLLTEADTLHTEILGKHYRSFYTFDIEHWRLCGKLLMWNAASREMETCAVFYSQTRRSNYIATVSDNVVGIEVFTDALISLLLDE